MLHKGLELVPYRKAVPHTVPVEDVETAYWRSFLYLFGALDLEEQINMVKRDVLGHEGIFQTDQYATNEYAIKRWRDFYDPFLRDLVSMCNYPQDSICAVLIKQVLENQIPQNRNVWDAIFGSMRLCPLTPQIVPLEERTAA